MLLIIVFSSCGNNIIDPNLKTKGSLTLVFGFNTLSKTIVPDADMNIVSYDIQGNGPGGSTFSLLNITGNNVSINDLVIGSWTVVVYGKNAAGTTIGSGSSTAIVQADHSTPVSIIINPLNGNGTLSITISWDKEIPDPNMTATLTKIGGTPAQINNFTYSINSFSYINSAVAPGYYTLQMQFGSGTNILWGATPVIRIITGLTTSVDLNTEIMENGLSINISNDLQNPIEVNINGGQDFLTCGTDMSLTAVPELPVDTFAWYLNGTLISGEIGNSLITGSTLNTGVHRIDVIVTKGSVLSSTNIMFTVTEDTSGDAEKIAKVYGWLTNIQLANGLLETTEGSNFVSLYDNCIAAIVFTVKGDYSRAEAIFDFFDARLETEMKVAPGGYGQFRDAAGNVASPHRWMGDNSWLLIALNNYHSITGSSKYINMSSEIESWLRSLQDPTNGGIWGGFESSGVRIDKNIEGNIDAFNAVSGYDTFHSGIISFLSNGFWDNTKKVFKTPLFGIYEYALDLCSWGFSAFREMPETMLSSAVSLFLTTKVATVNNTIVTGFCFDVDLDTIWLEGTAEMVVAYNTAGLTDEAETYLRELEKLFVPGSNTNFCGIPYASNPGTHFATGSLWTGVDTMPAVSSSAWYLLGMLKYDPMVLNKNKNIPEAQKFWK
ncbi:MAG: hypothetical protein KAS64_06130 [Spirochaetes bacterium]|nr:hypothetical protein [Spirochaetota bacterium]